MRRPATFAASTTFVVALATVAIGCTPTTDDAAPTAPPTAASTAPVSVSTSTVTTSTPVPASDAPSTSTTVEADVRPTPVVGEAVLALDQPVDLAVRPGDEALYLVERVGRVVAWRDGVTTVVLDIVGSTEPEGEQGLLGLAFSADGDAAWVNYTDLAGDTVVTEYPVGDDGVFDVTGARRVLTVDQPYPNHNGGDLVLGPDGYLYIGTGDGGAADDPRRVALDPGDLLGKMLRIDPDGATGDGYTIPDDNPFVDTPGARPEVWSVGLRNPWRFGFDAATGDLWIADVGQGDVEEIDVLPADADGRDAGRGASLGWSAFEGDRRYNEDQTADGHVAPLFVYTHDAGRCSVSGGSLYRGSTIAGLDGWYVFGDWCTGEVWALEIVRDGEELRAGELIDVGTVPAVVNIAVGPDGELWALSLDGGVHPILD